MSVVRPFHQKRDTLINFFGNQLGALKRFQEILSLFSADNSPGCANLGHGRWSLSPTAIPLSFCRIDPIVIFETSGEIHLQNTWHVIPCRDSRVLRSSISYGAPYWRSRFSWNRSWLILYSTQIGTIWRREEDSSAEECISWFRSVIG